jgi:putative photosynthetic complex assembly protein 2
MGHLGWALAYAIGLWWLSTGVILFLNHLPQATFRVSLGVAGLVLLAAIFGIYFAARSASVGAAYVGFTCALLAWGWQEMSFFMGLITGPRRSADVESRGWQRFCQAAETLLYHEAAIALVGGVILLVSIGQPNKIGCWTYFALWIMRISAKFNVYLGVRNLNEQWVPRRLSYLSAYMSRRRMNWLLPFSVAGGILAAGLFAERAAAAPAGSLQVVGTGLVAVILGLGVLEHVVMVLPMDFAALWRGFAGGCPVAAEVTSVQVCPHARGGSRPPGAVPPLLPPFPNAVERS